MATAYEDAPPPYVAADVGTKNASNNKEDDRTQEVRAATYGALFVQRLRNTPTRDAVRFTVIILAGTAALCATVVAAGA
jgi:hypothetical protein